MRTIDFRPALAGALMMLGAVGATTVAGLPAYAHEDDDARTARDAVVTIDVLASIRERCGFLKAPASTSEAVNFGKAGQARFDFTVDCNTPFAIGVSSANGAFKATTPGPTNGFRTTLDYTVGLSLDTSGQALTPADCASASLSRSGARASRCAFFGDEMTAGLSSNSRIAIEETGQLRVSWPDPDTAGPRLIAGQLTDTITITIGARS